MIYIKPTYHKPIIRIDCDNTITELVEPMLDKYNKEYNDNLTKDNITNYSILSFIKPECKDFFIRFGGKDTFLEAKPYTNAVEVVTRLIDKYDVRFTSSCFPTNVPYRHEKLESMFPNYTYNMLEILTHKNELHTDLLIDDCYANHGNQIQHSILYSQPWNTDCELLDNIVRMDNWLYIEKHIKTLFY